MDSVKLEVMSPRLAAAIETAHMAGRSTLALFETPFDIELKGDSSPVTEADKRAEEIVRVELNRRFPGESVLGEEQGLTGSGDDRWVVDPIDGTKSFVCGVPLYATLLSFEKDGYPELGVCYIPPLDMMFYAERGGGAFLNGRPIRVKPASEVRGEVISTAAFPRLKKLGLSEGYERMAERTLATRTWQDAYGHMLVACGRIIAMVDPTVSRWDISAVIPIIEEAGGRCTRADGGNPLEQKEEGSMLQLLSSNGMVHDEMLREFGQS